MLATAELIREAAQPEKLRVVLPRYLADTPLYREISRNLTHPFDGFALSDLSRLPFMTKRDIRRDFPRNFLSADVQLDSLLDHETIELEHTSGTSEERTALLLPRGWWAQQERRTLELNALVAQALAEEPDARRVTISSPVCSGEICYTGVPSREERIVGHSLFLSLSRLPFLWSDSELTRMAEETNSWQPRFLDVDPVYGVVFARFCERQGIRFPSLRFVLCSYEYVSVTHRRILERAFRVPVFDLYGSTETGHLLMQDACGEMRPSLETAVLEVVGQDAEGIGELVVTTLTNQVMPLIRYRIGDLVQRIEAPYLTRFTLHGRIADAFLSLTGHRVTTRQVDQCFVGIEGIAHYQLVERPRGQWLLRFVPDGTGPEAGALATLQAGLRSLLQPASLKLESTDLLMPESSGKFRLGYPALNG